VIDIESANGLNVVLSLIRRCVSVLLAGPCYLWSYVKDLRWTIGLVLFWADIIALVAGLMFGGLLYGPMGAGLGCLISQSGLIGLLLKDWLRKLWIQRRTRGIMDGYETPQDRFEEALDYVTRAADKERAKTQRI
jgi:hypothetical protein